MTKSPYDGPLKLSHCLDQDKWDGRWLGNGIRTRMF
ncbi:hypothetical protein SAMN04488026_108428 [Aliiruegeria lutimaris]|uniref:Uncharacterized protein n=1 Tax=Aliiruegeria lutimaris TaxID=571298 RepID=A0A1G9JY26_9RHOB|nr:hypothetical protein SAMN04488026_108428 [Aliiruegeria lutimaris]